MTSQPWFELASAGFQESADVSLEVEGQLLPAHSQFLAYQSRFFENMLKDLGDELRPAETIKVPASMLSSFTRQDVEAFLCQVYNCCSRAPESVEQAHEMYRLADCFDAPKLMKTCVDYLMAQSDGLFKDSSEEDGVLKWVLLAQQYGLADLQRRAVAFIVNSSCNLPSDARLPELSPAVLLQLVQAYSVLGAARKCCKAVSSSSRCQWKNLPLTFKFCSAASCYGHVRHVHHTAQLLSCECATGASHRLQDCQGQALS